MAMRSPPPPGGRQGGLFWLRTLLKALSYSLEDVVDQKVQVHRNGWTAKTMLALFNDTFDYQSIKQHAVSAEDRKCKKCNSRVEDPLDCSKIPWKMKVPRCKEGLDQDAPCGLNDAEAKDLILLEEVVDAYKKGIC